METDYTLDQIKISTIIHRQRAKPFPPAIPPPSSSPSASVPSGRGGGLNHRPDLCTARLGVASLLGFGWGAVDAGAATANKVLRASVLASPFGDVKGPRSDGVQAVSAARRGARYGLLFLFFIRDCTASSSNGTLP